MLNPYDKYRLGEIESRARILEAIEETSVLSQTECDFLMLYYLYKQEVK